MKSGVRVQRVYALLVLVRLFAVFVSFGYLHPDSFFQSPEVVAGDVFGIDVEKTWEFEGSNPCRSIIPTYAVSSLPFLLLKPVFSLLPRGVAAYCLYVMPRIFLFFASLIIDYTAWRLCGKTDASLLTSGSSWLFFVMLLQPFSNTTETLILALFSYFTFYSKVKSSSDFLVLGALTAWGIFNRFSFAFYAFPILLYIVYEYLIAAEQGTQRKSLLLPWSTALGLFSCTFIACSAIFIFVDSIYFGTIKLVKDGVPFSLMNLFDVQYYVGLLTGAVSVSGTFTVTPLNSLRYNLNEENLSRHGLSPRISHLLFHVPALFGPLVVIGLLPYYQWLDDQLAVLLNQVPKKGRGATTKRAKASAAKPKTVRSSTQGDDNEKDKVRNSVVKLVMVGVVCSSTLFLSLSPHQEMRFLLPNIFPLIILGSVGIWGKDKKEEKGSTPDPYQQYWTYSWIIFNVVMVVLMGVMHQGGVVRSLISFQANSVNNESHHLIYYHTYMPPKHLLAMPKSQSTQPPYFIHDLMGSELSELRKTVLRIKEGRSYSQLSKVYLVAPGTVELQNLLNSTAANGIDGYFSPVNRYWPHLSFEDFPKKTEDWLTKLSLVVYTYNPSNADRKSVV